MVALAFGRMTVAVGVALLTLTACSTRTEDRPAAAECAPENQRYCAAAVGDLLDVTLADLRPTQPSLGYARSTTGWDATPSARAPQTSCWTSGA